MLPVGASEGTWLPSAVLGKTLPHNLDAERAVLGAILLNDLSFGQAVEIIDAPDFYHPPHQMVFAAMKDLANTSRRIDLITLQDELAKRGQLDKAGGPIYLISMQEDIPPVGLIEQHARMIKEKAMLRELISSASRIITTCYGQQDDDIAHVLDVSEKIIFEIANKRTSKSFVQLDLWLKRTFQHLAEVKSHRSGITGIPAGLVQLDTMTSGMQKGDLIILAARPSMGKTALALNIALNSALEGFCVAVFSLEMPAEQLVVRLLSNESSIAQQKIRNATISSDEWVSLTSVAAKLAELKLFIDDTAGLSISDIRSKARRIKAEHHIDLLVIDYLQLLHATSRHENRHQEVAEISRLLKGLAKELGIPILALSQLSRAVESRIDKRPIMSDLRESGALEQDADVILFLYRDILYNPETENPALAELIIGKQRNGPTGTIFLNFDRELTKFSDGDSTY